MSRRSDTTDTGLPQRKHLQRLDTIFATHETSVYLITVCTHHRRRLLADTRVADVLLAALARAPSDHGWSVGRYVIMPDHRHFFCAPVREDGKGLSSFVGFWKRDTAARIRKSGYPGFRWQAEFFDHLMRSGESYEQKWEYVRLNPVRGGLVSDPDEWPYQGELVELTW